MEKICQKKKRASKPENRKKLEEKLQRAKKLKKEKDELVKKIREIVGEKRERWLRDESKTEITKELTDMGKVELQKELRMWKKLSRENKKILRQKIAEQQDSDGYFFSEWF